VTTIASAGAAETVIVAAAVFIAATDAATISTGGRDGVIWATTSNTLSDGDMRSLGAMPLRRLFTLMAEGDSLPYRQ